ncbi:hypothetical protein [Erythrobacter sp. JK5]|uniref:hypothetical protein n=1 Tax=Erythrobacter sp. JK5 TaxID=2829500 RepID=UPI001BAB5E7E|nr:hypothetical protein [Erythrobacter sp. JK5]QUL39176.1 hypothetical protein KDC96_07610 [Erythrobacter sp. JK5]
MASDIALPILTGPVGFMLAAAFACAVHATLALRPRRASTKTDALDGLFQRETLASEMHEAALRHRRAHGQRRAVCGRSDPLRYDWGGRRRRQTLEEVAAVLRSGQRNGAAWEAVVALVEGEGFVIVDGKAEVATTAQPEIAEFAEIEEVKLLPPPTAAAA